MVLIFIKLAEERSHTTRFRFVLVLALLYTDLGVILASFSNDSSIVETPGRSNFNETKTLPIKTSVRKAPLTYTGEEQRHPNHFAPDHERCDDLLRRCTYVQKKAKLSRCIKQVVSISTKK
jgi:hypothetical protein